MSGGKIDYSVLALPKSKPKGKAAPKRIPQQSAKQRKKQAAANDDREVVFKRQGRICFAANISPVCQGRAVDPHELIPVGLGGPRVSWNRVGICRACHRAAQGSVGGNRLIFTWKGQAQGEKPNADVPGNVTCYWKGRTAWKGRSKS